ncbi:type II toxin-antitoxin system VapC family toxin [Treponema sp.]
MNYILDTYAVSETIKPKPNTGFVSWLRAQDQDSLFISTVSLGEIRKGIERLPESKKKHDLQIWLLALIKEYKDHFLSFDEGCALSWGILSAQLELAGKMMSVLDVMIAATALSCGYCLVTRNESDYQHAGVQLLNPWTTS